MRVEIVEKGKNKGIYYDAKIQGKLIGQFLLQSNNKWQWRNSTRREQFYADELFYIGAALRKLDLISGNKHLGDHAKACDCGSVNFALRDDCSVECNKCGALNCEWICN